MKSSAAKLRIQARINRRPKELARRRFLARERRRRGIMGRGGPDVSHRRDGSTFLESRAKNRARNGKGRRLRLAA
jgi:hypothetical protein